MSRARSSVRPTEGSAVSLVSESTGLAAPGASAYTRHPSAPTDAIASRILNESIAVTPWNMIRTVPDSCLGPVQRFRHTVRYGHYGWAGITRRASELRFDKCVRSCSFLAFVTSSWLPSSSSHSRHAPASRARRLRAPDPLCQASTWRRSTRPCAPRMMRSCLSTACGSRRPRFPCRTAWAHTARNRTSLNRSAHDQDGSGAVLCAHVQAEPDQSARRLR